MRDFNPYKKINKSPEPVEIEPLQVTSQEVSGDMSKMIKKFMKKVKKEEVLKPFYKKLMYFETKSQKRRQKRLKAIYENKKAMELKK